MRRHPTKGTGWVRQKYFHGVGSQNWVFATESQVDGNIQRLRLFCAMTIPIVRHVKIRRDVNPYDPTDAAYFVNRKAWNKRGRLAKSPDGYAIDDDEQLVQFLNRKDRIAEAASRLAIRGV